MSVRLDVATTFAIKAATPYGVNEITIFTSRMTTACNVSTKVRIGASNSSRSCITLRAAMPVKIPKITTAIIDVERSHARSWKILVGIKLTSISGIDKSLTFSIRVSKSASRVVSRAPSVNPSAVRPKSCVMVIPMSAAIMVVSKRIEMEIPLILPSAPDLSSFTTAAIIDTNTNGMMIILSKPT